MSIPTSLLVIAMVLPIAGVRGDTVKPGTDGTCTSYDESKKVIDVEKCDKAADKPDEYDYASCLRTLRERTKEKLCKRGAGTYKWKFQVGDDKTMLVETTTCK
jgi:hypothetical protein